MNFRDPNRLETRRGLYCDIKPAVESVLKDKENNSIYSIMAYRKLTYEEMLCAVRYYYQTKHPRRGTWLKNHSVTIITSIGGSEYN
jgi:hypothetical protein